MEENNETTDNTVVVEYQYPSVKDQLIGAGLSIAVAVAAPLVAFGAITLAVAVGEKVQTAKARRVEKKLAKQAALTTETN